MKLLVALILLLYSCCPKGPLNVDKEYKKLYDQTNNIGK